MARFHRRKFSNYRALKRGIQVRHGMAHRRGQASPVRWIEAYDALKAAVCDILPYCPESLQRYEDVDPVQECQRHDTPVPETKVPAPSPEPDLDMDEQEPFWRWLLSQWAIWALTAFTSLFVGVSLTAKSDLLSGLLEFLGVVTFLGLLCFILWRWGWEGDLDSVDLKDQFLGYWDDVPRRLLKVGAWLISIILVFGAGLRYLHEDTSSVAQLKSATPGPESIPAGLPANAQPTTINGRPGYYIPPTSGTGPSGIVPKASEPSAAAAPNYPLRRSGSRHGVANSQRKTPTRLYSLEYEHVPAHPVCGAILEGFSVYGEGLTFGGPVPECPAIVVQEGTPCKVVRRIVAVGMRVSNDPAGCLLAK